ncbi:YetF domain-containing protein [Streptomyces sp. CC228A]|uniref:YetF domain-containing protein n=1 Tax=Streptomyces sp. CC228A TaxID=2898186 RepID=UPI001F3D74E3|nr:YetF domain-containing protein [Streptomyces sp. CC228A]
MLLVTPPFLTAKAAAHSTPFRRLIKAEPALLLRDGRMPADELTRRRVTESEVRQAIRAHDLGDLSEVAAVVLETDGTFSVIPHSAYGSGDALKGVRRSGGPALDH